MEHPCLESRRRETSPESCLLPTTGVPILTDTYRHTLLMMERKNCCRQLSDCPINWKNVIDYFYSFVDLFNFSLRGLKSLIFAILIFCASIEV